MIEHKWHHLPQIKAFKYLQEKIVKITASVSLDYAFEWDLEAITKWQNPKRKKQENSQKIPKHFFSLQNLKFTVVITSQEK